MLLLLFSEPDESLLSPKTLEQFHQKIFSSRIATQNKTWEWSCQRLSRDKKRHFQLGNRRSNGKSRWIRK
jgi:hypothetical protein